MTLTWADLQPLLIEWGSITGALIGIMLVGLLGYHWICEGDADDDR